MALFKAVRFFFFLVDGVEGHGDITICYKWKIRWENCDSRGCVCKKVESQRNYLEDLLR